MTEPVQLFLALGLMISLAKLMGYVSGWFNQPVVLGELLAGVLLGPTVIGLMGQTDIFPDGKTVQHSITEFAEIGVLLLIFAAGLEIDLPNLLEVGRPATFAGVMGVLGPVIFIVPAAMLFGYGWEKALFISLVLASMSTAISAQVMLELGVLQLREGLTLLGAALVDDLLLIFLVSLYLAINPNGIAELGEVRSIGEVLLRMVVFLLLGMAICWYVLPRLANKIHTLEIAEGVLALALVATLLMAFAAEYFGGVAAIAGAFMVGISLGQAKQNVVDKLHRSLHAINYGLFVPLFFISIGLKANLRLLDQSVFFFTLVMLILAVISKVVGTWVGTRLSGFDNLSAVRVGLGMISRGEVGLIMAAIGINSGILAEEIFSVLVFIVLITTIITPPLVRWSFSPSAEAWLAKPKEVPAS